MTHDRFSKNPKPAQDLLGRARALFTDDSPLPRKDLVFSKALRARLRALGYARD
jgi:hypothetical protein